MTEEKPKEAPKDPLPKRLAIEMKKLSVKKGDVLIVRSPMPLPMQVMQSMATSLRDAGHKDVTLLNLLTQFDVQLLNVDQMAKLGWVRKKPSLLVKPIPGQLFR